MPDLLYWIKDQQAFPFMKDYIFLNVNTNLFLLKELVVDGYQPVILDFFSIGAILCGILVIINKNPIVSILFLIGLFASIASYLITIGLSFLGLSYLIVYIGAVSILFLFILMLINIRTSELQSNTSNSIYLAIFAGISLNLPIFQILPYSVAMLNNYFNISSLLYFFNLNETTNNILSYTGKLSFVTGNKWENGILDNSHITSIGTVMYTTHNLWLIITSLILLLAMVGSIIIILKPNYLDETKNYKPVGQPLA